MKKRTITVTLDPEFSTYNFEKTLGELRTMIDELIEAHGKHAYFDFDRNHYYPYDNNPTPIYSLRMNRFETDEEYEIRVGQDAALAAKREAKEREEYERLRAKFG